LDLGALNIVETIILKYLFSLGDWWDMWHYWGEERCIQGFGGEA